MAARSRRGRTAVALSLGVALCGCAPDLRLGPSSGTDGGGASGAGGSTTTSSSAAGSGGTSMSGGGSGGVDNGGVPIWATSLAGDGDETPRAIVQNSAGEILVAAEMTGSLDVSNLDSAGSTDVALVRFSGIGKAIAGVRLGGLNPQTAAAAGLDHAGSTLIVGDFSGSISAGAKQVNSSGGRDGYVAKLDGSSGTTWLRNIGGLGHDGCTGVAADSLNNVVVVGTFTGDLGAGVTSAGGEDAFVMKLGPGGSGSPAWVVSIGDVHAQRGRAIAIGPDDNVFALIEFEGTVVVGGQEITSVGGTDILVLQLGKDGQLVSRKVIGTAGDDAASRLVVSGDGQQIIVVGSAASDLDLGGGVISGQGFVAAYDGGGEFVFGQGLTSKEPFAIEDVALDPGGDVVLVGRFAGTLGVADKELTSAGGDDVFAMRFAADGQVRWVRSFGGAEGERATRVMVTKAGTVVVAGTFSGNTIFGVDSLGPTLGEDLFLLGLNP